MAKNLVWNKTQERRKKKGAACTRETEPLTGKSVLRAKAHEFTLHEALIAKSCGSDVEFLIYSF